MDPILPSGSSNIVIEARGDEKKTTGIRQPGARAALITLTAINFLNFADRYVPSAVKSLIQEDLRLSDFQTSLPSTGDKISNIPTCRVINQIMIIALASFLYLTNLIAMSLTVYTMLLSEIYFCPQNDIVPYIWYSSNSPSTHALLISVHVPLSLSPSLLRFSFFPSPRGIFLHFTLHNISGMVVVYTIFAIIFGMISGNYL